MFRADIVSNKNSQLREDKKTKNILIVENDDSFLSGLQKSLVVSDGNFRVKTSFNTDGALGFLKVQSFDLLLFGPKILEEEFSEILNSIGKEFNGVPMVFVSATHCNESYMYSRLNVVKCLGMPYEIDSIVKNTIDLLYSNQHKYINGFTLDSLIQTVGMDGKTCSLLVYSQSKMGIIYFEKGELNDAETGKSYGQDAINEMFSWHNPNIEIRPGNPRKSKEVTGSIFCVLMEAYTYNDEVRNPHMDEEVIRNEVLADPEDHIEFLKSLEIEDENYDSEAADEENVIVNDSSEEHLEFLKSLGIEEDYREEILDITIPKEDEMKISRVNELIEELKENFGSGLVATDIFMVADGQSIAGYNSQAKASALFNQMTDYIVKALSGSGFPELGKYYFIELEDGHMVLVLPLGRFRQGLFINSKKVQLGLVLNVILPDYIEKIKEALA